MSDLPGSTKRKRDKNKKPDDQVKAVKPSGSAERGESKPLDMARGKQEVTPVTEYTKKVDLEPEVEGWLEKLEKEDTSLSKPVIDPSDKNKKVLKDTQEEKGRFKVILPLTKEEVDRGLHHKVIDSVRWLAEWCVKMIKMFHGKVAYRRK